MEIENQEIEIQLQSEPFVGGGGAVNSVNGMTGDVVLNAEDVGALPDTTLYAASLLLTIDSLTYVLTGQLKDQNGNNLGTAQVIDLPLESMVVSGSYDATTKSVILTLNNGQTITFSVADLVSGLQTEITENNKLDSDLVDDTNQTNKFITQAQLDKLDNSLEIESVGNGLNLDANGKLDITTFTVLTDDDANYEHPDEPDTPYIALWLLPAGKYIIDKDATIAVLPGLFEGAIGDMYYSYQNPIFLSNNTLEPNSEADIHALQAEEAIKYLVAIDDGETDERNAYTQPFIGTDGVNSGAPGLVPIPEATDVDKFLKSDGTWEAVSGGGPTVVQSVGNSTTDVMSQNATTRMIFKDNSRYEILISGGGSDTSGIGSVAIGYGAQAYGQQAIAIASGVANAERSISIGGHSSNSQGAQAQGSIALGFGATTTQIGEMNIGTNNTSYGYNSSNYRLLSGIYDGQNSHDAATVGQINNTIDAINTALNTNIPHIGA